MVNRYIQPTVSSFGTPYEIRLESGKYSNGNYAIKMFCRDGDSDYEEPYANLTVNLGDKLNKLCAYVDTNNFPEAQDFIQKYELGERTGKFGISGYCVYPMYRFNEANVLWASVWLHGDCAPHC